jgi:hypothetical protein
MRFKSLFVGAVVCAVLAVTGTAFADPSGTVKEPKVKGETLTSVEGETASFEGGTGGTGGTGGGTTVLPFTGADITLFLVIGLAAIGAGAALVRRARS